MAAKNDAYLKGLKDGQQRHPNLHVIEVIIKGVADRVKTCQAFDDDDVEPEEINEVSNFRRGIIAGAASMIQILVNGGEGQPTDIDTIHGVIDRSFADVDSDTEDATEATQKAIAAVLEVCQINQSEPVVLLVLNKRDAFVTLASLACAFSGVEDTNYLLHNGPLDGGNVNILAGEITGEPLTEGEDEPIKNKLMTIFSK